MNHSLTKVEYMPGEKLGLARSEFPIWVGSSWRGTGSIILIASAQESLILVRRAEPDDRYTKLWCVLIEDGYIDADDLSVGDEVAQIGSYLAVAASGRGKIECT